jgi:hypothetical protein
MKKRALGWFTGAGANETMRENADAVVSAVIGFAQALLGDPALSEIMKRSGWTCVPSTGGKGRSSALCRSVQASLGAALV